MHELPHIQQTIASLKHPVDYQAIARIPVREGKQLVAFLRPVPSQLKGLAAGDARLMTEWRNLQKTSFFTWFTSTEQSTAKWLTDKYAPDCEDVIFMVETPEHVPFGHVALYNFLTSGPACEFGRVLRGPGLGPGGGMTLASLALLLWATSELKIERFFLEVFKDNKKAISLYERLGFSGTSNVPLKRSNRGGLTRWEKMTEEPGSRAVPDGYALKMETTAEKVQALGRG